MNNADNSATNLATNPTAIILLIGNLASGLSTKSPTTIRQKISPEDLPSSLKKYSGLDFLAVDFDSLLPVLDSAAVNAIADTLSPYGNLMVLQSAKRAQSVNFIRQGYEIAKNSRFEFLAIEKERNLKILLFRLADKSLFHTKKTRDMPLRHYIADKIYYTFFNYRAIKSSLNDFAKKIRDLFEERKDAR